MDGYYCDLFTQFDIYLEEVFGPRIQSPYAICNRYDCNSVIGNEINWYICDDCIDKWANTPEFNVYRTCIDNGLIELAGKSYADWILGNGCI